METPDWYETGRLDNIKRHRKTFKPRLGTFAVCRSAVSEAAIKEIQAEYDAELELFLIEANARREASEAGEQTVAIVEEPSPMIQLLSVGYERAKLTPIIDSIVKSKQNSNPPIIRD